MLMTADIHWAAGFLDGEGSFSFQGRTPRSHGKSLKISAKQKYPPSLEKLKRLFGGGISYYSRTTGNPIHSWAISSVRAADDVVHTPVSIPPRAN
jgi:hypothetical protein